MMTNSALKTGILAIAMIASTSAFADVNLHGEAGDNYTNLSATFGGSEPGFTFTGNWAHSDNDGDVAGLGMGYNFLLGSIMVNFGGKAMYLNPNKGNEGYAVALGGGATIPLGDRFALFGDYYYSPDSLSSGVKDYTEAGAGARFQITKSFNVEAGYRYIDMEGKDGHQDNVLADGAYAGMNFSF
ncbi:YfaZ precursor [Yokenella regensburgei]|jgi:opacity protein-like surface antigen|uniref:Outer membrane protein n=2 Tax=Yokenella regensburgei TaxID=158877 RepID=A0AB38G1I9_9ENTR|nr:YfaZ [Yokenella regensburgei ATCC 43003]RKR54762.1 YfaZ precursor [Yokenella regensburgei]SQA64863.1 outer membrane protein [Yokenella regensburgei]SQA95511.1 outer membrane protein [Yokenella regensburgei]SUQ03633.1 outer membrane protein [Yokenella regensburgei]